MVVLKGVLNAGNDVILSLTICVHNQIFSINVSIIQTSLLA